MKAMTVENHLSEDEPKWFAVYTKYKREKIVHKQLVQKGIETFLPLQKVTRYYTRKIKHLELPLLSCYIFVKIVKGEYVPVVRTPDVVDLVRINKNIISIPEREINILRQVVGEKVDMEMVKSSQLKEGDWVEIVSGRLVGLKGQLIEQKSNKNFVISLEKLGYDLHLQVDPKILQKTRK
jgi:transcriptional antiterminator RfaH